MAFPYLIRKLKIGLNKLLKMGMFYVCLIDDARCEVGIQEVPNDSALGRGSDNVVEIYSHCYEKQPLVIQGTGAGNDTTAAGVLADILDIQDLFP
ncbi:hypothetical protein H5410_015421 [Solanum commersonii]|uniref:Homoserine dehydrogenase catalytic domain-containing protein n=1 Tax=Solanum commersonii TaxID=4109 RepID=A0A9J5ZTG4_SOLCO|nr:hypothetical protein H5410_015421 [Solanum commersonii]